MKLFPFLITFLSIFFSQKTFASDYIFYDDSRKLDSIVTYNGHYIPLTKEDFSYETNKISEVKGFEYLNNSWEQIYLTNYTYDNRINILSEIKTMIGDPAYIALKNIFAYDENNNFQSEEFYLCDSSTDLVGVGKYTYSYNPDQTIKEVTSSVWNKKTASWIEDIRYKYEYDSNQNQTLIETLKKNLFTEQWENSLKTERIFNASNILLEETNYEGLVKEWIKASKKVSELKGNLIDKMTLFKNNGQNAWINSKLYEYLYTDGKISLISESVWDGMTWTPYSKEEYLYNNGEIESIKSSLKKSGNSWSIYLEKYHTNINGWNSYESYMYDPFGKKLGLQKTAEILDSGIKVEETYSWLDGSWVTQSRNKTNYDASNKAVSVEKHTQNEEYYKVEFDYLDDSRILSEKTYDWYQNSWAMGKLVLYSYADTLTGIENQKMEQSIKVNAWKDLITITSSTPVKNVKVYSITGKLIHNGDSPEIETSSWAREAYIVSVTTRSGEHKSSKVLVR